MLRGRPDVVAVLVSARDDPKQTLSSAQRGGSRCVPSQATRLLAHLERDSRITGAGDMVGRAVAEELAASQRRRG